MSNTLYIECFRVRPVHTIDDEYSYWIYARDEYGHVRVADAVSYEQLLKNFPTKLSILNTISVLDEFDGAFDIADDHVELYSITGIFFHGFDKEFQSQELTIVKE